MVSKSLCRKEKNGNPGQEKEHEKRHMGTGEPQLFWEVTQSALSLWCRLSRGGR